MATVTGTGSTPVQFSGLASGVDTSSIVTKLVALESAGLNQMQAQKNKLAAEQSAYTMLGQKLATLQTSAAALANTTTFDAVSATASSPDAVAATASAGALQQTYNVTILNRSSASRLTSGAVVGSGSGVNTSVLLNGSTGLATALTSSTGSFTVNGTTINYDTTQDNLSQVLSRINNSNAGVNAMYDKLSDKIVLSNRTNGSAAISVSDVTGNLAAALNLTVSGGATDGVSVAGKNAQITIDGLNNGNPIQSTTDTFSPTATGITGLTLTVKQNTGSSQVTVGTDTTGIASAFTTFTTAYNDVQSFISQQTAVTGTGTTAVAGVLAGDLSVKDLASELRSMLNVQVGGLPSGLNYLSGIGVGTTGVSSTISVFDSSKLTAALTGNLNSVKTLLTDPVNGVMTKFNTLIQAQSTSPTGLIHGTTDTITLETSRLTDSMAREQRRIDAYQTQLQASFTAMETAVSSFQGGLSQLLGALGQPPAA